MGIGDRGPVASTALYEHLVPGIDELPHTRRRQRNPVLVGLDLCRNTNVQAETLAAHVSSSRPLNACGKSIPARTPRRLGARDSRVSFFEFCAPPDRDDYVGTGSIECFQPIPCRWRSLDDEREGAQAPVRGKIVAG